DAFINGDAALHIDGSFRIGTIASSNPDLNYGVAELPAGPNGERHTFGSYWTHGITRQAAADEAKQIGRASCRERVEISVDDGIRDFHVTGVQTCALPIWMPSSTEMPRCISTVRSASARLPAATPT